MDHDLDLDADGPALTAALTDIASVSGEESPLADAIERALAPLPHLAVDRYGNTLVARTVARAARNGWCWLVISTPCRTQATSRRPLIRNVRG